MDIPSLPSSGPRITPAGRAAAGVSFGRGAADYDRLRPTYPEAALAWLLDEAPGGVVVDVGAGTGAATAVAKDLAAEVIAVDPDAGMLARLSERLPGVTALQGRGEALPLANNSADTVLFAQSWHWVDPERAAAEACRVLRPGGRLGVLLNQLDVRNRWVHRLARIMHAGDVYNGDWRPDLGQGFGHTGHREFGFTQELDTEEVVSLAHTRSYWLSAPQATRDRVDGNVRWYLTDLGYADGDTVALPYRCLCYRADTPL